MAQAASRPPDIESQAGQAIPDDDHHKQSQSAQNQQSPRPQSPQGESNAGDRAVPLFSLYSGIAKEQDDEMTDRWQQDAKGILIFTGLFSAAISVLLAVSVLDLKPNSQDISAVYLANIFQVLARADLNITLPPISIPPIPSPEPFSPPTSAIWVNSLWFLSLVINLTCALLATSLHQWSRRYIRFTRPPRCEPEKRARLRAFFRGGMDKMYLPSTVESLPALIHLSLFLFFAGLAIFLFNINHGVFVSVIWWIGGFTALYGWMTAMPIFWHDSPYNAPLSSTAWTLHAIFSYALYRVLALITPDRFIDTQTWPDFRRLSQRYRDRISGDVQKAAEETSYEEKRISEIDHEILDGTLDALGNDETLETFFEAIPGFFNLSSMKDSLTAKVRSRIVNSMAGFLNRDISSSSISEEIKIRRIIICIKAIKEMGESDDIYRILSLLRKGTLGEDDNLLEMFLDIIPYTFNSQLMKTSLPDEVRSKIVESLEGFFDRNLASKSVSEKIRIRRLVICMKATKEIGQPHDIHRILSALTPDSLLTDDDDLLEQLLAVIPDLFDPIPEVREKHITYVGLLTVAIEFLSRTLEPTVIELVKNRRLDMCLKVIKVIYSPNHVRSTLLDILQRDPVPLPPSMEIAYTLSRWCAAYKDMGRMVTIAPYWLANTLIHVPKWGRDGRWMEFVKAQFNSSEDALREYITPALTRSDSDSVVLGILIHVTRRVINAGYQSWGSNVDALLRSPSGFDILACNTLPELQNEFCALWNELVQKVNHTYSNPTNYLKVLRWIRRVYIDLHQGTDAAPTAFDSNTSHWDDILFQSSSYPLCNIDTHRPTQPIPGSSAAPQQAIPSTAHHSPLAHRAPFPSSATDSLHIAPQVTSDTTPSIRQSVPTVNLDLNPGISMEGTHLLIDEMREYAQTSSATLLTHSHPEPVPATVTFSIVAYPPTASVEQQYAHNRQDTTASHAGSDIALISSNSSGPQLTPFTTPPAPSGVIPTEPPPSVESALVQHDHLSLPQGFQSSTLTTANSQITPQGASVFVTRSIDDLSSPEHGETRDPNPSIYSNGDTSSRRTIREGHQPLRPDVRWASALAMKRNELSERP